MKTTIGPEGLRKTWQDEFPETTKCCRCGGVAKHAFTAHEGLDEDDKDSSKILRVHEERHNSAEAKWLHDCSAVSVYFCQSCLEPTALYNQG